MKKMDINEIRKEFLDFFKEKEHLIIKSFPLIPEDDDSLLLINAGMAPMKKYFTGEKKMPKNRVSSSQRCIRTADIENVGKTQRHATFFEMLGNFSFGDYFKKEAIQWAWEFMTERMEIPKEKIWVSVYTDDDEAYDIWKDRIGVDEEHIVRLGKEDNFWELEEGPCGPCSEIHIDRGEDVGCGKPDCKPGCDCDRFVEVWNLVFTQFNKDKEGNYSPLKHPNIDTGMGLERLAMISQDVDNIFEIQSMKNIISEIESLSGKTYKDNDKNDISMRIIADHAKAMTFLTYDGVVPSNEGRGYILRRIIRRASRHGKLIGIEKEFLNKIVDKVIASYKPAYPELTEDNERIHKIIATEESKFQETIDNGLSILDELITDAKSRNKTEIDPKQAFRLYDTFGFPPDLTTEILEENELSLDMDAFNLLMQEQKDRSRRARTANNIGWSGEESEYLKELPETEFTGYTKTDDKSKVIHIFKNGEELSRASEGDTVYIVTEKTPFYGEGGGQVGDTGVLITENGHAKIIDTVKNKNNGIIHIAEVDKGTINKNDAVRLKVDVNRRRDIMKNHSATHLLHQALRDTLGDHIHQAGSLVSPDRLRFDFTHYEAISQEDLEKVEKIVNEKIALGLPVKAEEMTLEESQKEGAMGLFEDKYKDIVRVLSMGDYSKELCGGTHVDTTSDIQMFKILSESSVAAGTRRIEAITGRRVYEYLKHNDQLIKNIMAETKVREEEEIIHRIHSMDNDMKEMEKELNSYKQKDANKSVDRILEQAEELKGFKIVTHIFKDVDMDSVRNIADSLKQKIGSGAVVLATINGKKVNFVAAMTEDIIDKGVFAGNVVRDTAKIADGNGGGRKDFAAAGGKNPEKTKEAIGQVSDIIEKYLN